MLGHEPLPRDDIKRLGNIFADLGEIAATTARARGRRRMNDAPARQIGRKVAPRRLAPVEALHLDACCCFGLGLILSRCRRQLFELQFHLLDKPLALLRARTELLTLHLGDHQLQMLDQRLRAHELGARLGQRSLERIGIVGKVIISPSHAATAAQAR